MDFVQNNDDRETVFSRIRGALGQGPQQPALPGLNHAVPPVVAPSGEQLALDTTMRRLSDFQRFHQQLDHDKQFPTDPYFNFILLQEEMGELARAFAARWMAGREGHPEAMLPPIRDELADVLAYIVKLANYAGVDLEEAYLEKMRVNMGREWHSGAEGESA
jgi:NTP pyrophosphatase (non-canonical NTP hydrolase)